jgi:hypothetical protein
MFVFESLQAKRYDVEEDGTVICMVLVKWAGFSVEDSTWEDPVEAGLCKAIDVENYTALLLDCTGNPGMSTSTHVKVVSFPLHINMTPTVFL